MGPPSPPRHDHDDDESLAALIVAAGFPPLSADDRARIRAHVDALAHRALAGYRPSLDVFAFAVQGGPDKAAPPLAWPDGVRWLDLALVDGFRRGHLDATLALVDGIMGEAAAHLRRLGASPEEADDLVQERLARLLGPRGSVGYGGRGPLAAWIRRCLERDLLSLRRRAGLETRLAPRAGGHIPLGGAMSFPELPEKHEALKASLQAALAALPQEMRRLLRYIHVDGLTSAQAGALLGVHRVSIQRRLAEARHVVKAATRGELLERHGIAPADASSLVRTLLGGFDLTVSHLLHSA